MYRYSFPIDEALDWVCNFQSLREALVDLAAEFARREGELEKDNNEWTGEVEVDGELFIIWIEQHPQNVQPVKN